MADGSRKPPPALTDDGVPITPESLNANPQNKPFTGAQWAKNQKSITNANEPANSLPGGTQNTAGGSLPPLTLTSAFPTGLTLSDFTSLPSRPCVRDAFLTGLGSGFAIGGVRALFSASVFVACSWAVGAGCVGSGVAYQWCLVNRRAEREGMTRAVEILNRNAEEKRRREERRKKREGELEAEYKRAREREEKEAAGRSWWRVW